MLLKIGDFSKLSRVTIKTLRYYDDLGLLKPAHIDPFTKYRYYIIEQLAQIHRIIALKELGISLEQIGIMIHNAPSKEQIKGMLMLQEADIEQRMREEQARLALVRFRLRMLDMEEEMPDLEIIVKKLTPIRILQMRKVCAGFDDLEALGIEIESALPQAGITLDTDTFQMNIFHSDDYRIEDVDLAMAVPVADSFDESVPLASLGTMTVDYTAPVDVATFIHRGEVTDDIMQERLVMLRRWCVANNYQLCDEYRFIFYKGPMSGYKPKDWVVEIQHVIEPQAD